MKQLAPVAISVITLLLSQSASADCDSSLSKGLRFIPSGGTISLRQINALRASGCTLSAEELTLEDKYKADAAARKLAEQKKVADEQVERETKQKKSVDTLNAQIAEDNAKSDAFDQEMADKCGEYPMQLKIGMPEKQLVFGCAGQASLAGESYGGRVYRVYGALVSVQKGRVVRWVRE